MFDIKLQQKLALFEQQQEELEHCREEIKQLHQEIQNLEEINQQLQQQADTLLTEQQDMIELNKKDKYVHYFIFCLHLQTCRGAYGEELARSDCPPSENYRRIPTGNGRE